MASPTREATCMPRACSSSRCSPGARPSPAAPRSRSRTTTSTAGSSPRRSLVPEIPAALDDLVARATAVEPDDRFESADGLRHGPARGPARPVPRRARPPRRRRARPRQHLGAGAHLRDDAAVRPPTGRPAPARPMLARRRHRTRPNELGRSALAGLSVHDDDDGPLLEHTAAMPIDRHHGHGARRRWPLWIAAALIVAGAAFGGWWFTAGPGGSTVVPAVVGQQISQAEGAMRQASLSVDTTGEFSEVKAKGVVLRVEPTAGSELGKRSTVRLVVSKGQERYAVPNLVGLKAGDLGSALSPPDAPARGAVAGLERDGARRGRHLPGPGPERVGQARHRRVRGRLQGTRADRGAHRHRARRSTQRRRPSPRPASRSSAARTSTATPSPPGRSSRSHPRAARCTAATP